MDLPSQIESIHTNITAIEHCIPDSRLSIFDGTVDRQALEREMNKIIISARNILLIAKRHK